MTVPHTSTITIWQPSDQVDEWGRVGSVQSGVFKATYEIGGSQKLTDSKGLEFSPMASYWTKLERLSGSYVNPVRGGFVAQGIHKGTPQTADANGIRGIKQFDNTMFGQPDDYLLGV